MLWLMLGSIAMGHGIALVAVVRERGRKRRRAAQEAKGIYEWDPESPQARASTMYVQEDF